MNGPKLLESYKYSTKLAPEINTMGKPYNSFHTLLGVSLGQNVPCKLVCVQYSLKENVEKYILFFLGEKTFVGRT